MRVVIGKMEIVARHAGSFVTLAQVLTIVCSALMDSRPESVQELTVWLVLLGAKLVRTQFVPNASTTIS